jgi:hypothetical protein
MRFFGAPAVARAAVGYLSQKARHQGHGGLQDGL